VSWGSWLDEYDREARLVPALLAILPLALAAIGLGFNDNPILLTVVGVLVAVGAPMVVAKQVADRGRAVEEALYVKWGAPPTTLMLVPPSDEPIGEILQQRRARLEQASGISLPTDPTLTDVATEKYQAAVRWLIENTRDHNTFPVVWSELKTYGFERNSLGLRRAGILSSLAGILALIAGAVAGAYGAPLSVSATVVLAGACAVVGLWWWRVPSEDRVRTAADRYAARLLDAAALLSSGSVN
jgi:hypothetical protein